jgi:hypothetical protein
MKWDRTGALVAALFVLGSTASARASSLWISEVFYDAVGSDDGLSFVEFWGTPGLALDGWMLEGINGADGVIGPAIALAGSVGADGLFLLADSVSGGGSSVPGADQLANFDFQNGPDSIVLRDPAAAVADALGYGVFAATDVFAGEGSPAIDPPAGQSLARRFANVDTGNNAADFAALETPTPGSAPLAPEPAAPFALATALCALAALRRRSTR